MYLLDTNVVSELRKPRPHGAVVAWIDRTADEDLHFTRNTRDFTIFHVETLNPFATK